MCYRGSFDHTCDEPHTLNKGPNPKGFWLVLISSLVCIVLWAYMLNSAVGSTGPY